MSFFPHIFVWGSCFWFCTPASSGPPPPPPASSSSTTCPHTTCPHNNFSTHNLSTHNLSTQQLVHTQLVHTHTTCPHNNLLTQLLVHTHTQLVHTQLAHATTCPHTTCSRNLSTQPLHTQLVHTQLVHTQLAHVTTCPHTTCLHTTYPHNSSTHNFSTHNFSIHPQLVHTTCTHNFSTHKSPQLVHTQLLHILVHRQLLHRRGLGDIHLDFAWPAWHLATSSVTLRGRRGTWRHGPPLCVAGVALMARGWLWWRAWFPVGAVDAAAVCVARVALGDIERHFAWQAWHLATWTSTLCGRRGTYGTGLALVARLVPSWRRGRRRCLHGRRGTWRHRAPLCVAGVALGDIERHFAWQAWHLATSRVTLRGRRGTYGTGLALVACLVPSWRRGRRRCLRHLAT